MEPDAQGAAGGSKVSYLTGIFTEALGSPGYARREDSSRAIVRTGCYARSGAETRSRGVIIRARRRIHLGRPLPSGVKRRAELVTALGRSALFHCAVRIEGLATWTTSR
jgi:hypothetical protein